MLKRGIPAATLPQLSWVSLSPSLRCGICAGRHGPSSGSGNGTLKQSVPLGQREQTVVLKMVGDPVAVCAQPGAGQADL